MPVPRGGPPPFRLLTRRDAVALLVLAALALACFAPAIWRALT